MIKNTKSEINVEATLLKARLAAVSENTYDSAFCDVTLSGVEGCNS
jgi:hypothetical protein